MKKITLLLSAMLLMVLSAFADEVWKEDFSTEDGIGAIGGSEGIVTITAPSSGKWSVDTGTVAMTATSDYFKVKLGVMETVDTDGEVMWMSQNIDILAHPAISISMSASSAGDLEGTDYIKAYYRIDEGPETLFGESSGNFLSSTFSVSNLSGDSLFITVKSSTDIGTEYIRFDDVIVKESSTAPVITNFLPEDGSEIQKDSSFTISAIVVIPDVGGIDSVMLYSGSVSGVYDDSVRMTFSVDTFSFTNTFTEKGIYYGKIVAYGVNGDRTMSDEQSITIYVAGPEMFNTSPASGSVFDLGVPVLVETEVSAPVGVGIDSVMFFYGPAPEWMVMTAKCVFADGKYSTVLQFDSESAVYGQLVAYGSNGENDSTEIVTAIGQCGDREAPVATAASELAKTTFTANWDASAAAEGYLLDVWTQEGEEATVYASSRFDSGVSPFPSEWTKNDKVLTTTSGFEGTSALKLGTADIAGVVTSPAFTATEDFSVVFYGQEYNGTEQSISLSYGTQTIEVDNLTDQWLEYSVPFTKEEGALSVSFTAQRANLDSILIQSGGMTKIYILQDDSIKTGTSKEITGLAAGTDYLYAVKAYTEYGCQSDTSNTIMLTTVDLSTALSGSIDKSVRVSTSTGLISVEAAGVQSVTVFDIMGREIESRVMDTEASFAVKQGIYLVRVADTVSKVVVK